MNFSIDKDGLRTERDHISGPPYIYIPGGFVKTGLSCFWTATAFLEGLMEAGEAEDTLR